MELVDPNTQDFQYLTLSQYNGEKQYVRARCEVRKDEPFITDTSNAFVCVESFRLSCAPNEGGIVYRMLPNTYAIQVEKDEIHTGENKDLVKTHLTTFQLADGGNQSMRIVPKVLNQAGDNGGVPKTVSINEIVEEMAQDLNPVCVTNGTLLDVTWNPPQTMPGPPDANGNPTTVPVPGTCQLLEDPLTKFRGPAMGPHGMLPCYCSFESLGSSYSGKTTVDGNEEASPVSSNPADYRFAQIRINKADVPNIKINDLAIFLSSKVNLYRDDFAGTETREYFRVSGPNFIATDVPAQTMLSLIATNGAHLQSPRQDVRLYCKDSMYKKGGTVYMDHTDDNGKVETVSSKIEYLDTWYEDKGDHYMFYLSGLPSQYAVDLHGARTLISNTNPNADSNRYHIYKELYATDTDLFQLIAAQVKVDTISLINQINDFSDATYAAADTKTRVTTTRRPTLGDPIPCFTPLDMFEKFNTGWKDSAPIQMQTDPNGGFRITVLEDGISTLRISQALLYDMGLNSFLTQEGVVNKAHPKDDTHEYKVVLLEVHRTDQNPSVYKWQDDYNNPSTIQSHMIVGNLEEFAVIDPATQAETYPLTKDTVLPAWVVQISSGKFYRAVAINGSTIQETEVTNQNYEGRSFIAPDGLEYIEWKTPMKGAYIGNDNQVSVGSFSIYENIRLVATGFGFQPFIVARADQPVLCELRLPFSNSASLASGSGANQITLMNTTSEFYGDIIYEAPASGHQYLRLNSQQPIYDMTIEPRLIPRDPDLPQERVMLGFSDVFQVKLRFLMRN